MRIYGLTGGMGAGKTEAARLFEEHGFPVLDADAIGHDVIAPGGLAERDVIDTFGDGICTGGRIDRAKLGDRVFNDVDARKQLNAIVHPAIGMTIAMRCAELAEAGHDAAIIDAALIAENSRKDDYLSGLIVVDCPVDERVRRLVTYRKIDANDARRRIAAQTPPEIKLAIADWVIDNSGDKDALRAQVANVAKELRQHAG